MTFLSLVEGMRKAQKEYGKCRDSRFLSECKKLEKAVDDYIKAEKEKNAKQKEFLLGGF